MSRRTERPYEAEGPGEVAPHSQAQCSGPEVNGPVAQAEYTSLLREICSPSTAATPGATSSNGRRALLRVTTPLGREMIRKIHFRAETPFCDQARSMNEAVLALEIDFKSCFRLQPEFAVLLSWIWGGKKYSYSIRASDR